MKLSDQRQQYEKGSLDRAELPDTPLVLFEAWLKYAFSEGVTEPNAFTLATVRDGIPSARVVLIKEITEQGIIFYSNYESAKAKDIEQNPIVAASFLWKEVERQVRIVGRANVIPEEKSLMYFQSRPKASQISAWASPQSEVVNSRDFLLEMRDKVEMRFANDDVLPLPPNWGGYEIVISSIEFWQGRPDRFHDRFKYSLQDGHWTIERLAP